MSLIGRNWKDDEDSYDKNMMFGSWKGDLNEKISQVNETPQELKNVSIKELLTFINNLSKIDKEFIKGNIR